MRIGHNRAAKKEVLRHQVRNLQGVYPLAQALAGYFPEPDNAVTGIYELLFNAIEHGNLGIGFEEKARLLRAGLWEAEIARRFAMERYAKRVVDIRLVRDNLSCKLVITDQGEGFAWREYINHCLDRTEPHGRGLLIALNSGFDQLTFNRVGNTVTCVSRYSNYIL